MKKNDVFTFTAPNGVEGTGVVTAIISSTKYQTIALCYAQNRLFTFYEHIAYDIETGDAESDYSYGEILVDYAILPDYDALLDRYNDIEVAQAETANGM
jgi:hypothetical protein